jgi:hypothetical protein
MNRTRLIAVLTTLALALATVDYAYSGQSSSSGRSSSSSGSKSYSSGSKSYSSSSSSRPSTSSAPRPASSTSSGSKSYSSGGSGSSGSKSYSSGGSGSNGSKSYSSGSSTPSASTAPKSVSGSGNKSYSSGDSGKSYSSGSATPSASTAPKSVSGSAGKTYSSGSGSSGSGKSYSSGNQSYSSSRPPTPPAPVAGPVFSMGNKQYTPAPVSPSGSTKPKGGAFDGSAAEAQKRVESKANYVKGPEPKTTYTTPQGQAKPIDPSSKSVQTITSMDRTHYLTRETRIHTFYSTGYVGVPYYSRPIVVYNDPYNSFFWYWMLDRSLDEQARWAYCHRYDMDSVRYQEMLRKTAGLQAQIDQLERQKAVRDAAYAPSGIDPDLQYTDDYVDAVYNPAVEVPFAPSAPGVPSVSYAPTPIRERRVTAVDSDGHALFWFFIGTVVVCAVIYLVFFHNWQLAGRKK